MQTILVLLADSEEGALEKCRKWKDEIEAKDLRVNVGKIKVMIIGDDEGC